MPQLALSALGRDRPGIVAAITGVLVEHEVNVEDSRMAILRGEFAMVLVLGAPQGLARRALEADLERARERVGLDVVGLTEVAEPSSTAGWSADASHMVTVYGTDHPGIVHAVAASLADLGANITDLQTRLVDEPGGEPFYAMLLEVALEPGADVAELERSLEVVGADQGVEVSVRPLEQDAL
jgi:glycine cleavage system transcriptional repressor